MAVTPLAARTFDMADQRRFAKISGDRNPMHLDAVAARRTPAGAPAVHGVHLLLWALDVLARTGVGKQLVRRLTVCFKRFVLVGEAVAITAAKQTEASVWLDLSVSGLTSAQIAVDFGEPGPAAGAPSGDRTPAQRNQRPPCSAEPGFYVVDPGFMVDWGVYCPPDQPHSPDQPR